MKKYTLTGFIEKSNKIFNYKYKYDKTIFINVDSKVIITCPIHGDFEQYPKHHLKGHECKLCSILTVSKAKASNTETFISRSNIVHKNKYQYNKTIYESSHKKVIITCPIHGDFKQTPASHLSGHECIKCSNEQNALNNIIITIPYFISKSNEKHNFKYDYSLIKTLGEGDRSCIKVDIICPIHGVFSQNIRHHLLGEGCRTCGYKIVSDKNKMSIDEFLLKANTIHDNKYDYSKVVYVNCNIKIKIICPIHGDFEQIPSSHLAGNGCPKCTESKQEKKIRLFLEHNNILFEQEKSFIDLKSIKNASVFFDFYLPNHNICIEYDGIQHYKPTFSKTSFEITKRNDILKNEYCKSKNLFLIRIPYWKNYDIENILKKYLLIS